MEADYIVVGAGSAGCVLAARLSEDPRNRVVLIEAGGDDRPLHNPRQFRSNLMIHIPVGFAEAVKDKKITWDLHTEPVPGTHDRVHPVTRGKVLGGCSSINAMLYVRGEALDYDGWRQLGCVGWGWDDVLPYFRRSQHQERGENTWHGVGGLLNVSDNRGGMDVTQRVLDACAEYGIPTVEDLNTGTQVGAARVQVTMRNGKRHSAAVAYLHPAMKRPNLRVITQAHASRILFDGSRACGVAYRRDGGEHVVRTSGEIVVASGAIGSPQLLELSGIGDQQLLRDLGIEVKLHQPQVGENYQDHYMSILAYELKKGVQSLNEKTRGLPLMGEVFKYAFQRRGLLAESAAQLLIYAESRPGLASPDIQFSVAPATMEEMSLERMVARRQPGLTLAPCHLRPESRGWTHIRSSDPAASPSIQPNFLSDPSDQAVQIAALQIGRAIARQGPLAQIIDHELRPGSDIDDDAALLEFARATGTTVYHPSGTVRMGSDAGAPLDPRLRVRGIEGLRVADASVMPRLISGNTNAPTIMIGEKAADMILEDARVRA